MATGPSTYLINQWLDAVFNADPFSVTEVWIQLHTADPGAAGTTAVATETDRQQLSSAAAASAAVASDAVLTWTGVAGSEDYTHFSAWDASVAGNFLGSGTVTANAVTAGDTFTIPAGDLVISMTPAS